MAHPQSTETKRAGKLVAAICLNTRETVESFSEREVGPIEGCPGPGRKMGKQGVISLHHRPEHVGQPVTAFDGYGSGGRGVRSVYGSSRGRGGSVLSRVEHLKRVLEQCNVPLHRRINSAKRPTNNIGDRPRTRSRGRAPRLRGGVRASLSSFPAKEEGERDRERPQTQTFGRGGRASARGATCVAPSPIRRKKEITSFNASYCRLVIPQQPCSHVTQVAKCIFLTWVFLQGI